MSLSRKKALLLWSDGVEIGVKKNGSERSASIEDFHNTNNEFVLMELGGTVKECPLKSKDTGEMRTDPEAIEYLDQCIKDEPDTKEINTHQGEYFPYRKELHSKIIQSFLDHAICVKQTKPIAVFMGGAPGSGKTTFLQKSAPYLNSDKIFKIDADAIRAKLPEYNGWNAWATQNETRDIINRMIEIVGRECLYDFVFDGTMTSPGRYISMIKKAQSLGYETFVIFVDVPREVSEQRALDRFKQTGRYVAKIVFDEFYAPDGAIKSLDQVKRLVDGYIVVDGVDNYRVIERGGKQIPQTRPYEKIFNGEKKKIIIKRKSGGTIAEVNKSILNLYFDLKGNEKEVWMKSKSEIEEMFADQNTVAKETLIKSWKQKVEKATSTITISWEGKESDYVKAISDGRMTAQDAKVIIESADIEVPLEIEKLAAREFIQSANFDSTEETFKEKSARLGNTTGKFPMSYDQFVAEMPTIFDIYVGDKDIPYKPYFDRYTSKTYYTRFGRKSNNRIAMSGMYKSYLYRKYRINASNEDIIEEIKYSKNRHKYESGGSIGNNDLSFEYYLESATNNLKRISRTASGIIDSSSTENKKDIFSGADNAGPKTIENFESTIERLHFINKRRFPNTLEFLVFIESINKDLTAGIVKFGTDTYRFENSEKFPYTDHEKIRMRMRKFAEDTLIQMNDFDTRRPTVSDREIYDLVAKIYWRINFTDHYFADGNGKTAEALAVFICMRYGKKVIQLPNKERWYSYAPTHQVTGPEEYYGSRFQLFSSFIQSLPKYEPDQRDGFADGGIIPDDVSEVVKKYGWGVEPIAGTKNLQLISRKGNPMVAIEIHGAKYKLLDTIGNKLMSGRGMLAKSIETLLTKYYYAQPIMAKGGPIKIYGYNIVKDGKFLTMYGGQKYSFTDNPEFRYRWDDKEVAERLANHYGGAVVPDEKKYSSGGQILDDQTQKAIELIEQKIPVMFHENTLKVEYAYATENGYIFNLESKSEYPVMRIAPKMQRLGWKVDRVGEKGKRLLEIPKKVVSELESKTKLGYADGGITIGPSHAQGGIKFNVGDSGQVVELEGEEGVLKKTAMQDQKEYTITGDPRTIASCLNEMHGGKNFRNSGKKCLVVRKKQ